MTADTGAGLTSSQPCLIENFIDFNTANFNFQGASAYLGWSFAFSGLHAVRLHSDYVNIDDLMICLRWDFEIPAWSYELSGHDAGLLAKYGVNGYSLS